jgi:hypothetical protein
MNPLFLTRLEREQIQTILSRRANEIAGYMGDKRKSSFQPTAEGMPASVEYGLELEVNRLRDLATKVKPPEILPADE